MSTDDWYKNVIENPFPVYISYAPLTDLITKNKFPTINTT